MSIPHTTRRDFVASIVGAGVCAGGLGTGTGCTRRVAVGPPRALARLSAGAASQYSVDYGATRALHPNYALHAVEGDSFREAMRTSVERGLAVRAQGTRHSSDGQSLVDGGAVLRLPGGDVEAGADVWTIGGGTLWSEVAAEASQEPQDIAVYTDNLHTTVGGTLSVGGIGTASVRWGTQIDQLVALELLLPSGEVVRADAAQHAELFAFAPASLGSLGVILRAQLRSAPRLAQVQVVNRELTDSDDLLAAIAHFESIATPSVHLRWNLRKDGGFIQHAHAGGTVVRGATPVASSAVYDPQTVTTQAAGYLNSIPQQARVWCDYLLPAAAFPAFVRSFSERWFQDAPSEITTLLGSVGVRAQNQFPLAPNYHADPTTLFYSAGVYSFINSRDEALIARTRSLYDEMLAHTLRAGGRPYRHGYSPMSRSDSQRIYGEHLETFSALSSRVDGTGVMWNPYWGTRTP